MTLPVHRSRRRGPVGLLAAVVAVPALLVAGCGGPSATDPRPTPPPRPSLAPGVASDPLVWLAARRSASAPARQLGSAETEVGLSTLSGGEVAAEVSDEPGVDGLMLRFPAFTTAADYPRAVLTVSTPVGETGEEPAGDEGPLDPGEADFSFGADVALDAASVDRPDDNGNNVIQRGISSYPALFKLEVDKDERPTCTVRGDEGTVIVRSEQVVLPGVWSRLRCSRRGDRVEVTVGTVVADGTADALTRAGTGPIGSVVQSDRAVPLSVGGKVDAGARIIASASDQFNGRMANPYLRIDR